jgi:hypothetical protein
MSRTREKGRLMRKVAAALVAATSFLAVATVVVGQLLPLYFPYN